MSTDFHCVVHHNVDMSRIHNRLKEHIIVYDPPYDLETLMLPFIARVGRRVRIVVHHNTRNLSIIDADIRHHVLRTAISGFQRHRLHSLPDFAEMRMNPMLHRPEPVHIQQSNAHAVSTGKQCSICLETIMSNNLRCLPCAHMFHDTCISRWFLESESCPECRMNT